MGSARNRQGIDLEKNPLGIDGLRSLALGLDRRACSRCDGGAASGFDAERHRQRRYADPDTITATFLVDGQYDQAVLDKLNWFLRDWRRDEPTHMDPRLFDVVWQVYRESGSQQPIMVMSAYRSPETNAMLRRRSRILDIGTSM